MTREEYVASWVDEPANVVLAWQLNHFGRRICFHGRNPCFSICGVRREGNVWRPIDRDERKRLRDGFVESLKPLKSLNRRVWCPMPCKSCTNVAYARGLCSRCYQRQWREQKSVWQEQRSA